MRSSFSSARRVRRSLVATYVLALATTSLHAVASDTTASEDFAVHAQATLVAQFHPPFRSPYRGPNSLDPGHRGNETFDLTLYAGARPWSGAEIWVNGEVDQGFGLSNTLGAAGYFSGEAYKVGHAMPYPRLARVFLRQTIALGGDDNPVAADLNTLAGTQSDDRLVVTAGKISVVDVFDTNRYAHDPRGDFLNWSVIDAAAFDYAADAWGYTYGAAIEWYQDRWTLRAGLFNGSRTPNSKFLEHGFGQRQFVVEGEWRYALGEQPGKLKLLAFETQAKLARFADLLAFFRANPGADNVEAEAVRRRRTKHGVTLNVEQQVAEDLGFFLRASAGDGRTEAYEFTDADRALSTGLSWSGTRWNRPDDTFGVAAAINWLSRGRKQFLRDGGLGILIGDGQLPNAAPEQIGEVFYSFAVQKGVSVSVDYQLANHPAYNRDRGPVNVFGVRLHAQL